MIHHITKLAVPAEGLSLFVFGDLQKGSKCYNPEAWAEFRHQFKTCPRPAVALGLGDYGDFLRPSMRPAVESAMKKDDSARAMFDASILKTHDEIIENMDFLEGKLVGLHEGHHTWYLASGGNLDQRLASALKAPYLGWTASTRFVFERSWARNGCGTHVYTMVSTHGNANGAKVGAAVNWMEGKLVAGFDADHYVMGHGCKSANFVPQERRRIRRVGAPGVENSLPRCLIVGGFAQGYTNGWESDYVERAGMVPQPVGWGEIRFYIRTAGKTDALSRGIGARTNRLEVEQLNQTPLME
jgi:hypothetical protein